MPEKKNWSERYLRSDHHTDRLVNTVVNYERASGLDFADPDQLYEEAMARGRPGSDRYYSRASVSRHRAASVPVGTGRDPNLSTFIKAQDISSGVMDDSDAISSASKWRDQQLLSNISHTLAATSGYYPTSVPASRSRQRPRRASVASVQRYAHRRNSVANEPVLSQVPTPYTTQAFRSARLRSRASSVPPVPTYAASETPARKAAIYSSLMDASTHRPHSHAGGTGRGYIQVDSPLLRMAGGAARPIETLRREAPGYVHRSYQMKPDYTSGYSHIAPMRRSVVPAGNSASCGLAVRQARQCLGRLERELGVDDVGSSPYSYTDDSYAIEAPLASPIVVPTRVTSGRAYSRTAAPRRYSFSGSTGALSSAPSYSPSYNATPSISAAQNKITSIESQLELGSLHNEYTSAPVPYSALRSATVDARNKIDRHKTMLDRYLPINMGPENDVGYEVDYKYGQIADRRPSARRYPKHASDAGKYFARSREIPATTTNQVVGRVYYPRTYAALSFYKKPTIYNPYRIQPSTLLAIAN